LQQAAAAGHQPRLLISVDQEGGDVRRFPDGPPTILTRQIQSPDVAYQQGAATGQYLRRQGVNVDLAPIADVSDSSTGFEVAQGRGFSGSPNQVAGVTTGFAAGLQSNRVAATAKHFPGVGSLTSDTDNHLGNIALSRSALEATLLPFKDLISGGVALVMTANAIYPAFDPSAKPATLSPVITQKLLRSELGFKGVVITDALNSPTDLPGSLAERAVSAAQAGADIVLFVYQADGPTAHSAILTAAQQGQIPRSNLEAAYQRILALKKRVG
jgi:beta-N-acetylhexosaminidase